MLEKTKKGGFNYEKAVIVENKGCATCSIGAACLVDGPIPDFEIAGATGLFGLWG
ncbi:subtilosin A family bacteriocin [Bacillus inaquosorum]|nr:subtilosin A family bacteriocin [Bacillus inaquosorum]